MFEVKVLGTGCPNCIRTEELIRKITSEKNIEINLEKVETIEKIMSYGVMSTPGVVVDGKVVHAGGVPGKKAIIAWF